MRTRTPDTQPDRSKRVCVGMASKSRPAIASYIRDAPPSVPTRVKNRRRETVLVSPDAIDTSPFITAPELQGAAHRVGRSSTGRASGQLPARRQTQSKRHKDCPGRTPEKQSRRLARTQLTAH